MRNKICSLIVTFLLLMLLPGCAISDRIDALAEELRENGVLDTSANTDNIFEETDTESTSRDRTDHASDTQNEVPPLVEKFVDSVGSKLTSVVEQMLICIQQNDLDGAYPLCHPLLIDAGFDTGFEQLVAFCGGFEEYELTISSYHVSTNFSAQGKAKITRAEYLLSCDGRQYTISVQYLEDRSGSGLISFYLTPTADDMPVAA